MNIFPFLFFCFGLIIGSFLNVVLFRTETEEPLTGRSHCRSCRNTIVWYDNLPVVSFLFLSGKCRQCAEKISWRYPLVELATGGLFFLAGTLVFRLESAETYLIALWWCFLFSVLIIIALYDLDHMEIPVAFLFWGIGGTVLSLLSQSLLFPPSSGILLDTPLASGIIGGFLAACFFYLLVWMSRERWMGMGDVWLAFLAGMAVGPRALLFLLTLSFGLGAIVGSYLLFSKKKDLSAQVPFAPFLSLSTVIILSLLTLQPGWLTLLLFPIW